MLVDFQKYLADFVHPQVLSTHGRWGALGGDGGHKGRGRVLRHVQTCRFQVIIPPDTTLTLGGIRGPEVNPVSIFFCGLSHSRSTCQCKHQIQYAPTKVQCELINKLLVTIYQALSVIL